MSKLTVSIAQIQVEQGNPARNLEKGEFFIKQAVQRNSELIVFPEMWTTGYNWAKNEQLVHSSKNVIESICALARRYKIWINGSVLALNSNKKAANTSILINTEGRIVASYEKMHLFPLIQEQAHLAAGGQLTSCDTQWAKIGFAICYDLRFPVMFRSYALRGVELITLPAAVPHPRSEHWDILIRARAIENQLFVIAANQVGKENISGQILEYFGHSCIIDPLGNALIPISEKEELLTATLDLAQVNQVREALPFLKGEKESP